MLCTVGRGHIFAQRGPHRRTVRPMGRGSRGRRRRPGAGRLGAAGRCGRCAGILQFSNRTALCRLRRVGLCGQSGLLRHGAVQAAGIYAAAGGGQPFCGADRLSGGPHRRGMGAVRPVRRHCRCGGVGHRPSEAGRAETCRFIRSGSSAEQRISGRIFPRRRCGGVAGALMRRIGIPRRGGGAGRRGRPVRRSGPPVPGAAGIGGMRRRRTGRLAAAARTPSGARRSIYADRDAGGAGAGC